MEINHRLDGFAGAIDLSKVQIICVPSSKHADVRLCIKGEDGEMHAPFATIKLHSRDRLVDAQAVLSDATALGEEIARRWNAVAWPAQSAAMKDAEGVAIPDGSANTGVKIVSEMSATSVTVRCPHCDSCEDGFIGNPAGRVFTCDACGKEYKVHPEADIEML